MLEASRLPAIRQLGVIVTHAPQDDATPAVYEQVVALTGSDGVYQSQIGPQQRLQPVDTDSPRATLNGFLERSLGPFTRAAGALR